MREKITDGAHKHFVQDFNFKNAYLLVSHPFSIKSM